MLVRDISFITIPIYARLLSPEQLGEVKIYDSWLQIAVMAMICLLFKPWGQNMVGKWEAICRHGMCSICWRQRLSVLPAKQYCLSSWEF